MWRVPMWELGLNWCGTVLELRIGCGRVLNWGCSTAIENV